MDRIGKFVSLLILPLIAIIVYSSLRSFFLKSPPSWTFEMSIFLFGSFFMLGAGYCHMLKGHVAVDIVKNHLDDRGKNAQEIFSQSVVLFVVLVTMYISIPNAWQATLLGERSILQTEFNPYVWWFRWIIPIGCALIAWQCFRVVRAIVFTRPDKGRKPSN